MYSANNQPEAINKKIYPGYYLPENRAKQITQLLEGKNDWDKESTSKMITDVNSPVILFILKNFMSVLD